MTASTPRQRRHIHDRDRIPFGDGDANNEYGQNIQIAELNSLNATLAVIKFKKLLRFFVDPRVSTTPSTRSTATTSLTNTSTT